MKFNALLALPIVATSLTANPEVLADESDTHTLGIVASAPKVVISRRSRSASLALPALDYVFEFRTGCIAPFEATSLSMTIADSRKNLDPSALDGETSVIEITVPATQIPPVSVAGFCIAESNSTDGEYEQRTVGPEALILQAALSANASLLCVSEDERQILYKSTALDVTLICEPDVESEDTDTAETTD